MTDQKDNEEQDLSQAEVEELLKKEDREFSNEELLKAVDDGDFILKGPDEWDDAFNVENFEKFANGQITWAQLQGLSMEDAYSFAEIAYTMFEQGRYDDAKTIFEGLVISNPYDPYFHSMLGAIYARQNMNEEAAQEYTVAIELDPKNIISLVSRAEILLQSGDFEPAMNDLTTAIKLDPEGKDPAGLRARALAGATAAIIHDVIEEQKKGKK